eukprot:403370077
MNQNNQRILSLGLDLGHEDCVFCISYDFQSASLHELQKLQQFQQQQTQQANQQKQHQNLIEGISNISQNIEHRGQTVLAEIPDYIDPGVFKIPAYLAFTDSGIKVGQEAKDLQNQYQKSTVFNFKRLLFVRYSDQFFQTQILPNLPFDIEQGPNDTLLLSIVYRQQLFKLKPVDLFKIYLHHTLTRVIQSLQTNVDLFEIVATVPSTYDTLQIQQLINGCTINEREIEEIFTIEGLRSSEQYLAQEGQGISQSETSRQQQQIQQDNRSRINIATKVLRVIKESNAMALGYYQIQQEVQIGLNLQYQEQQQQNQPASSNQQQQIFQQQNIFSLQSESERNVIVYRVGWDSLDVTLVTISGEMIEIRAISGNNLIGGEEFLARLVQYCIHEFNTRTGIDLSQDKLAFSKLIWPCKVALSQLSQQDFHNLKITNFYGNFDLDVNLSRSKFEQMCQNLIQICIQPMAQLLQETKLHINQVNDIMLVGSFSENFLIQALVSRLFNGRQLFTPDNPSILGAIGAFLEVRSLSKNQGIYQRMPNLLIVDMIPLSLGGEIEDNKFHPIVHKSSSFPLSKCMYFTPQNQEKSTIISIKIYEGINEKISQNTYLGQIKFKLLQLQQQQSSQDLQSQSQTQRELGQKTSSGILGEKQPKIEIKFDIDSNKLLQVTVTEIGTQNKLICLIDRQWINNINFLDQTTSTDQIQQQQRIPQQQQQQQQLQQNIGGSMPNIEGTGLGNFNFSQSKPSSEQNQFKFGINPQQTHFQQEIPGSRFGNAQMTGIPHQNLQAQNTGQDQFVQSEQFMQKRTLKAPNQFTQTVTSGIKIYRKQNQMRDIEQ